MKILLAKIFIIQLLLNASFTQCFSQLTCFTDSVNKKYLPESSKHAEFGSQVSGYNTGNARSSVVKTIPVVVHIIHQNGPENISDAQVLSQIEVLNKDFRRLNADTSNTNPLFQGVAADMEVEFCLATKDPNGNPTTGIDRILSSQGGAPQLINLYGWDNHKYLNFYVTINTGCFSSFPWSPDSMDGIFITHGRFGTVGTAGTEQFAEFARFGRTASHEVGHYLGLYHTFYSFCDTTCMAGDSVCDTPPADMRWVISTCLGQTANSCTESPDLPDQVDNYMDYNVDSCTNMFSLGQKARALAALNVYRSQLWSNANLIATGCNGPASVGSNIPDNALSVFPNPASNQFIIEYGNLKINSVEVYDAIGQRVLWLEDAAAFKESKISIGASQLKSGFYLLKLTGDRKDYFTKIIKE